ncbi:hypothetical protein JXB02_02815 [Candidatus Woesearchaeota archaeon]|nr:hypothetical protein [Candidatus Woesearchaeota archaeon]
MRTALSRIGICILLMLAATGMTQATDTPILSAELYGTLTINGEDAPIGAEVVVTDPSGTVCGRFTVETIGRYGLLSCHGDIGTTPEDEGAVPGETLSFAVEGTVAVPAAPVAYAAGEFIEVGIAADIPGYWDVPAVPSDRSPEEKEDGDSVGRGAPSGSVPFPRERQIGGTVPSDENRSDFEILLESGGVATEEPRAVEGESGLDFSILKLFGQDKEGKSRNPFRDPFAGLWIPLILSFAILVIYLVARMVRLERRLRRKERESEARTLE